jgi:peroxiredoxin
MSKDAGGNEATLAENQTFKTKSIIPVGSQKGNRAPDFTLKDLNGKNVKLSDFQGKIVMVNFWATWCVPCKDELPFFQAISKDWSGEELVILAIHVKNGAATAQSWINDKEYTFPVLLDSEGNAQTLYGFTASTPIPKTFFIDRDGIIREVKDVSFSSKTEIENILNSLQ